MPPNRVRGVSPPPPPGGVTTGGTDWAVMSSISMPPPGRYMSMTSWSQVERIGRSAAGHRNSMFSVVVVMGWVMGVTSWAPLRVMVTWALPVVVDFVPHRVTRRSLPVASRRGSTPTRRRTSPPLLGVATAPVMCWSESASMRLVVPVVDQVPTVWTRLDGRTVIAGAGGWFPPGSGSGSGVGGVTVPGSVTTGCPVRTSTHVFDWVPPVVTPVQMRKIPGAMCASPGCSPFAATGTGRPAAELMNHRIPPPAGRMGLGQVPSVACLLEVTIAAGSATVPPPPPVGRTLASSVRVREFWEARSAATVASAFSSVTASMSMRVFLRSGESDVDAAVEAVDDGAAAGGDGRGGEVDAVVAVAAGEADDGGLPDEGFGCGAGGFG